MKIDNVVWLGSRDSANFSGMASRSALDEVVREGARRMLQSAVEAEVAEYVEQFGNVVDTHGRLFVMAFRPSVNL